MCLCRGSEFAIDAEVKLKIRSPKLFSAPSVEMPRFGDLLQTQEVAVENPG